MTSITPSVKVEQRTGTSKVDGKVKTSRSYRVVAAQRTTVPHLGQEFSQSEMDKFFKSQPDIRVNIVLA